MREKLRDPDELQRALHAKLLRAMCAAVAKVSRAARGHSIFKSDRELRACLTLTRLAGVMTAELPPKPYDCYDDPDWWTEDRKEAYEELMRFEEMEQRGELADEII